MQAKTALFYEKEPRLLLKTKVMVSRAVLDSLELRNIFVPAGKRITNLRSSSLYISPTTYYCTPPT
jgi:hypothetical protein